MPRLQEDRLPALSGLVFVVLAVIGNAMQGSMPRVHGDAKRIAAFYADKPLAISIGMSLSLVSLFFLARPRWWCRGVCSLQDSR